MHHLHIYFTISLVYVLYVLQYILTESSKDGFAGLTAGVEISTFLRLDPQSHDMAHPGKNSYHNKNLSVIELNLT